MVNKKTLLLLSSVLFFTHPFCQGQEPSPQESLPYEEDAYEGKIVSRIEIKISPADTPFNPEQIISRLKTKEGSPFSYLTFDSDLKTLSQEYAHVEPAIELKGRELTITLIVTQKPIISAISWEGNQHVKTKELQKELGIKAGKAFDKISFNSALNKVKEFYIKKGFFESEISYTLSRNEKTGDVAIKISVQEGRSGLIDQVVFQGFSSEEESEILNMMYTKPYQLFTSWITGKGTYYEEALEHDHLTIVNFLQNKGYADAHVDIEIRESKSAGKIVIAIIADKGPVYHFADISFTGNHLFSDKEIENQFTVGPGDIYSPSALRQTMQSIQDLYGRKGYIETHVQYETYLIENKPAYNVVFQIEEGEEYRVGIIRIFGNVHTQSRVILHESLLVPGESFDAAKLKATQRKLENIGYFKKVNVYAVKTEDDEALGSNYRDVFIEVEESTTGNANLFFGFSSSDSIFGGLDLTETNFTYKGLPGVVKKGFSSMRGGGEYMHARLSVGSKERSYSISWLNPYFRDTLWRVGFELINTFSAAQSKDYQVKTLGGSVYGSYPINRLWSFGVKYRARRSFNHVSHEATDKEREQAHIAGIISAVSSSLNFDSTDSPMKPHNGFRSVAEAELAGLGGDFSFARFSYINTYYASIWSRGIMKYRFDFKFIDPFWRTPTATHVPISERFFLGGEASVRGYRAFDIGPHFSNGDPTGGISSSLFSVEYLQEIFSFLDGFVFFDAGSVSLKRFYVGNYKLSYGIGARVELINRVPIVLGLGFPINPSGRSEVRKFFFSMGGQF